ncbi:hypothetical protein ACLKA7_007703, partial [Drosophila subpalustris]
IEEPYLYMRTEHASGDPAQDRNSWKLWVPQSLRLEVLQQGHDNKVSSHGALHHPTIFMKAFRNDRGKHRNPSQDSILLELMRKHPDMARNYTRGDRVAVSAAWVDLAVQLNPVGRRVARLLPHCWQTAARAVE